MRGNWGKWGILAVLGGCALEDVSPLSLEGGIVRGQLVRVEIDLNFSHTEKVAILKAMAARRADGFQLEPVPFVGKADLTIIRGSPWPDVAMQIATTKAPPRMWIDADYTGDLIELAVYEAIPLLERGTPSVDWTDISTGKGSER
jgi:hypothetical protein